MFYRKLRDPRWVNPHQKSSLPADGWQVGSCLCKTLFQPVTVLAFSPACCGTGTPQFSPAPDDSSLRKGILLWSLERLSWALCLASKMEMVTIKQNKWNSEVVRHIFCIYNTKHKQVDVLVCVHTHTLTLFKITRSCSVHNMANRGQSTMNYFTTLQIFQLMMTDSMPVVFLICTGINSCILVVSHGDSCALPTKSKSAMN